MKRFKIELLTIVLPMFLLAFNGCSGENASDSPAVVQTLEENDLTDNNTVKSEMENDKMQITVGDISFTAIFCDNSSAQALKELLKEGPLTIDMSDYNNMEKVGSIGTDLPRNDEQITTEPGDIILYQGDSLAIYYDTNSWDFTKIGKINDITGKELKAVLGTGDVTVTFSLLK